jgi:hypothetical protein
MADFHDDEFEWDLEKAAENVKNHEVSFEEARQIFEGRYRWPPDELHSNEEDRYKAIGFSGRGRMLTVSYCERGPRKRIITAWKASPHEFDAYDAAF